MQLQPSFFKALPQRWYATSPGELNAAEFRPYLKKRVRPNLTQSLETVRQADRVHSRVVIFQIANDLFIGLCGKLVPGSATCLGFTGFTEPNDLGVHAERLPSPNHMILMELKKGTSVTQTGNSIDFGDGPSYVYRRVMRTAPMQWN